MSLGLLAWVVLLSLVFVLELARREHAVSAIGRALGRWPAGRIALVAVWGFLGWHLLTRYGTAVAPLAHH